MIGRLLTELFCLESISEDEHINFFLDSKYGQHINFNIDKAKKGGVSTKAYWNANKKIKIEPPLRGVAFTHMRL